MLRIFCITLIHQGPARKRLFLASGLAGCLLAAGCISDLENRNYSSGVVSPASGTRRHHEEVALFSFDDRSFPSSVPWRRDEHLAREEKQRTKCS